MSTDHYLYELPKARDTQASRENHRGELPALLEERIWAAVDALTRPLPDGLPGDGEVDSVERTYRVLKAHFAQD